MRLRVWYGATVDDVSIIAMVAAAEIFLYLIENLWIDPVDGIGRNAQDDQQDDQCDETPATSTTLATCRITWSVASQQE